MFYSGSSLNVFDISGSYCLNPGVLVVILTFFEECFTGK